MVKLRNLFGCVFGLLLISSMSIVFGQTYSPLSSSDAKRIEINSENCTGFGTPDYKCQPLKVRAYLYEPKGEWNALVMVSHGAQGVDQRVFEYADALTKNGIAALVIDHWSPRNINIRDYSTATARGGTTSNIATDALWAAEQVKALYPQVKKMGFLGESMGAMAAIQMSRQRMTDVFNKKISPKSFSMPFSAMVGLYPACMERIEGEKFIDTPFLILIGELDDATLAKDCVDHQAWTNANGGNLKTELVPGAYHDFDAPHALQYRQGQNISKCTYVVSGDKITIVASGKTLPNTLAGLVQLPRECAFTGFRGGHGADKFIAVPSWLKFYESHLK